VAGVGVVEITDPSNSLGIVLRMIYSLTSPSLDGNLDTLAQCPVVADKYGMKRQEHDCTAHSHEPMLPSPFKCIAFRFGFPNLVDSTFPHLPLVYLPGISELPNDFEFTPATTYHRHHTNYLEAVVEVVDRTPLKSRSLSWHADGCSGLFRNLD
jgi:hypothetical protein